MLEKKGQEKGDVEKMARERWLWLVLMRGKRVPVMDGAMVVAATGEKSQLWHPLWPLSLLKMKLKR